MRKKELRIQEYKNRYKYECIAMVFMPNRFSQKLGRWEQLYELPNVNDEVKSYITVPINFKEYKNPKTLIKRLNEFNYILVHETDIDIIEKLKELNVNFRVLPSQLKKGCIDKLYKNDCEKLVYRSDYPYIRNNFLEVYEIIPKVRTYYYVQNEFSNPEIVPINLTPRDYVPRYVFKTRQEAYKDYVFKKKQYIEEFITKVQGNQDLLNSFTEKYKGEFDE